MIRILLVDDEANVTAAIARKLRHAWHEETLIECHSHPLQALKRAAEVNFDAIVSDYRMPEMNGIDLLVKMRALQPMTSRIILSGNDDFDVLMIAINEAGILRFVPKPWDDDELREVIKTAVQTTRQTREQQQLANERRQQLDTKVSSEAAMRRLEEMEPGITRVHWGPNGEVIIDDAGS